tara:strand:- start:1858 stop:2127 length:270 start_codon:yes stop_codon:yes gene_type:complete
MEEVIIKNPTAEKIKKVVDAGIPVHWSNWNYEVIKDDIGQYLVKSHGNNHYIGLTDRAGKLLNTHENYFMACYGIEDLKIALSNVVELC